MKRIAVGVVALVLLGGPSAWASSSHRAGLRIRYTTDLHDGEGSGVKGAGWLPNTYFYLEECNAAWKQDVMAACVNTTDGVGAFRQIETTPGGYVPNRSAVEYVEGAVGSDGGMCDVAHNDCVVVWMQMTGPGVAPTNFKHARVIPIDFGG